MAKCLNGAITDVGPDPQFNDRLLQIAHEIKEKQQQRRQRLEQINKILDEYAVMLGCTRYEFPMKIHEINELMKESQKLWFEEVGYPDE